MCTASRDENCIAWLLVHSEALHLEFIIQLLAKLAVQIKLLRVDRIVLVLALVPLSKELAQFGRIFRFVQVPYSCTWTTVGCMGGVHHNIDCIRHIHMQTC